MNLPFHLFHLGIFSLHLLPLPQEGLLKLGREIQEKAGRAPTGAIGSMGLVYLPTWTGWWFQTFFIFHPYLGKWSNLTNIFQMGWNRQPVVYLPVVYLHEWLILMVNQGKYTIHGPNNGISGMYQSAKKHICFPPWCMKSILYTCWVSGRKIAHGS